MDILGSLYSATTLIKTINIRSMAWIYKGKKGEFYFEYIKFEVPVGILGGNLLKVVLCTGLAVLDKSQGWLYNLVVIIL